LPNVSNFNPELFLLPILAFLNYFDIPFSHQPLLNLDDERVLELLLLSDYDVEGRGGNKVVGRI
jgi:hypothetical protein